MKQLFLTAAIVLGPAVSLASAEYLMIKIDLNKLSPPYTPNQFGPGMQPLPQGGPPRPLGPGGTGKDEPQEPPLWATAYLQLKLAPVNNKVLWKIDHPWGKALVPTSLGDLGTLTFYHQPSAAQRFVERRKHLEKEDKTPEKLLQLAEWALEHGLPQSFQQTMQELGKVDASHPAVLAVKQVGEALARPVRGLDPMAGSIIAELNDENFRQVLNEGGHYVLFTDLPRDRQKEADLKKWTERLEDNYRNFFYWFAARGRVLPVPTYKLVAVIVAGRKDFERKHDSLSGRPTVADGFLVRRENVAVFSAEPLDEAYTKLEQYNKKEWEAARVGRDDLLSGDVINRRDLAAKPMIIAKFETLAMLQKAMEKESARAAVTHEGMRQLLAATGLLPRGVVAAEWAHFGMASFFETPFRAYYVGVGLPHWIYMVEFKHLKKTGELGKSTEVLLRTISDRYFVAANTTQRLLEANTDEREMLEPVLQDELMTARTTAWALTYYLARHKLDNLEQYYRELASLPRDLEFDAAVLQGCFARAFGLADVQNPGKLDMAKVARLAEAWYASMEGESLDLLEVQTDALKERSKLPKRGRPNGRTESGAPGAASP